MKKYERELRAQSVGSAFVITNPLVRGLLTAILWIQPIPHDYVVVASVADAEAWIAERLRARGMDARSTRT